MALHETGEPAVEARISNLTSTGLWRGQDSASCFIKGSLMLEEFAYKYDTYEELLDAVIKVGGYVARRNQGTYINESGCGVHFDNASTHEVVIEMWAGDVCGLEDAERAEAIRRAVELSGVHGARVLVPDAPCVIASAPVLRCDGCTPAGVAALLHRPPRVRPVLDGRAHLVRRSYVAVVGT